MHEVADFRSDTVTRPTPAMRRAMAEAEVGDDVLGDDPTVIRLERLTAELFEKEAGLYVPSGSMGNSVCLATQTRPGDEVIAEEWAHFLNYEVGSAAGLWGILTRTLRSDRGIMDPDEVARWIRPGDVHMPRTALVAVENTHNFHGGAVVPLENLEALYELTRERGIRLHLDAARIWNAAAATGTPLPEYARLCDTMSVCLSKGLGAPVGSVVLGTRELVERARRVRKRLGGGMRQSGVIAAAGIVALETMRDRIPEDHANARRLAEGLAAIPGIEVSLEHVETNILFARVLACPAEALVERLAAESILTLATGADQCRFVTHADVDAEDVERALGVLRQAVA
ncbi:MAG: threonine aldolase family protein [Planctomycetota bacterium]|jgi:threonine aldolase